MLFIQLKHLAPDGVVVRHIDVPIRGLHPSVHGLKVAHISDLHYNGGNSQETGVSDETLQVGACPHHHGCKPSHNDCMCRR